MLRGLGSCSCCARRHCCCCRRRRCYCTCRQALLLSCMQAQRCTRPGGVNRPLSHLLNAYGRRHVSIGDSVIGHVLQRWLRDQRELSASQAWSRLRLMLCPRGSV
jgi:hypothetical protein